jgi:hypothetical protein
MTEEERWGIRLRSVDTLRKSTIAKNSPRTLVTNVINRLKAQGIDSIGLLMLQTPKKLQTIPGINKKGYKFIMAFIQETAPTPPKSSEKSGPIPTRPEHL